MVKHVSHTNVVQTFHVFVSVVNLIKYYFLFIRYKSILRLVDDNVGISQAADTSQSRSPRVKVLLSPTVINCLVYSGLTDEDSKVCHL